MKDLGHDKKISSIQTRYLRSLREQNGYYEIIYSDWAKLCYTFFFVYTLLNSGFVCLAGQSVYQNLYNIGI